MIGDGAKQNTPLVPLRMRPNHLPQSLRWLRIWSQMSVNVWPGCCWEKENSGAKPGAEYTGQIDVIGHGLVAPRDQSAALTIRVIHNALASQGL